MMKRADHHKYTSGQSCDHSQFKYDMMWGETVCPVFQLPAWVIKRSDFCLKSHLDGCHVMYVWVCSFLLQNEAPRLSMPALVLMYLMSLSISNKVIFGLPACLLVYS